MTSNGQPKFALGQILATPGALEALEESGQNVQFFLSRHERGDWGEVCPSDAQLNDQALVDGSRLLSAIGHFATCVSGSSPRPPTTGAAGLQQPHFCLPSIDRHSHPHRLSDTD